MLRALALLLVATTATAADMDERVAPCAACHGDRGRSADTAYYPSIAGKPAGYLYEQLLNFRDGRRHHDVMERMFAYLSDDYLRAIARYYAEHAPAHVDARGGADPALLEAGRLIVERGTRDAPACAACHGKALAGAQPSIPGVVGLPLDYINAQLGAWREGTRKAREPDCMGEIARALSIEEMRAAAAWIASRPARDRPLAKAPSPLPMKCGGVP